MDKGTTRRRLLDAAHGVMAQSGISGLTLDAVAAGAGISKGGLLHHFRTKDALLTALLEDLLEGFERRVTALAEAEAPGPGRWLRAYARASFDEEPIGLDFGAALLSAMTHDPGLRALVQADASGWNERLLDDGVPAARATVVRQAADAAWLDRLTGATADPGLRAAVLEELLALALPGGAR